MPLRLILMRHAKSDWSNPSHTDHDRELNRRGRNAAGKMANWLAAMDYKPNRMLCSSAMRTQQTANLMNHAWARPVDVDIEENLYLASSGQILETIAAWASDTNAATTPTLLVLGHNPGISEAASRLSGEFCQMPTAAVIVLDCDVKSWADPLKRELIDFVDEMVPKRLSTDDS